MLVVFSEAHNVTLSERNSMQMCSIWSAGPGCNSRCYETSALLLGQSDLCKSNSM